MPPLGSRVKRGRDCNWDDLDNFGLRTVIGHSNKGNSQIVSEIYSLQ